MRIDFLCSNRSHPVVTVLQKWIVENARLYDLRLVNDKSELTRGDILFLVSCSQVINKNLRDLYKNTLVLHASDLPNGRGWSPHIWEILDGKNELFLSLIAAEDKIDTGAIWAKTSFHVAPHALSNEINELLFSAEIELIEKGIRMIANGDRPYEQSNTATSYYPRRTPEDSKLDPDKTIAEQFNKLRVADPKRFPAFFELHGETFELTIKKRET